MLSGSLRQHYQAFQYALEQLRDPIMHAKPDVASLRSQFLEVQQLFQQQIVSQGITASEEADLSRIQSIQTEMNKQLRLLGMDIMFLQTARQPMTIQQRQVQMGDRLSMLSRYCQALLDE